MRDRNTPLSASEIDALAWNKMGGLIPAIVQDSRSGRALMLGYMDRSALSATLETGFATFFSRAKGRLWKKGESSGNCLRVQSVFADCDADALLVLALPDGPTCHTGTTSCFGDEALAGPGWLGDLSAIVRERALSKDERSYTRKLLSTGRSRVAQKVGEEGVEVALAAVSRSAEECAEELADLLYHVTVLMESIGLDWNNVMMVLRSRHASARRSTASS